MHRRTLLKSLAAVPAIQFLSRFFKTKAYAADAAPVQSNRRVRPSDPTWPEPEKWDKLKQEVGGNLIKVENPLAACQGSPGSHPCQEELINLTNPYYIGDQPGATQSAGWVNAWTSAPSAYAVAARSTADVVAAVNFARENNLRLVVKGGGHSYQGTSNAADSLLIWTRGMNRIVIHEAFIAQGCSGNQSPQPAVTVEAGAIWIDAYNEVTTNHQRYVQGRRMRHGGSGRPYPERRVRQLFEELWQLLQTEQQQPLVDALFAASRYWNVALHFNKGLAGAPKQAIEAARDSAMNPVVLNSFALAIIADGTPEGYTAVVRNQLDLASARSAADKIGKAMIELRKVVPDPGSYVSESNFFEHGWQQSFWGPNYSKLHAVKARYDPTGLFFVHHGVGSEEWSADGFTRLT